MYLNEKSTLNLSIEKEMQLSEKEMQVMKKQLFYQTLHLLQTLNLSMKAIVLPNKINTNH